MINLTALNLVIDVLFTFQTVALTHLVTPVEGIPSPGHLEADEALAGDERTAPGEGGGAPGVISTRVGQTGILLAGGGRDTESKC